MTLAVLRSRALAGLAAPEVTVEVHLAAGLPSFTLVGLPDTEVKEARDRVRAAIQNCGFEFPQRRITVNLAPADLPKESGRFDLPIALGILVASEQIKAPGLDAHEFAGELALSGDLRAVRGTLAMCAAIRHEAGPRYDTGHNAARAFVLPLESAPEAALIEGMEILPAQNLLQVCAHLAGREMLAPFAVPPAPTFARYPDLAEVKGQAQAKRALEVAAAGGHSLLMSGPPGAGKSMLAQRLPGLLPPMKMPRRWNPPPCIRWQRRLPPRALEAAPVSRAAPFGIERRAGRRRRHAAPRRDFAGAPRHAVPRRTARVPARRAGSPTRTAGVRPHPRRPRRAPRRLPGAIPARRGDEPLSLRTGSAHPAGCRCTPDQVARYRGKLSGPLLDRIDMMHRSAGGSRGRPRRARRRRVFGHGA
jgi:magnesium chelatase family protein